MFRLLVRNTSRLKRDEGGQAIIFVAVLGLVLVLFAAAVINVGNLATTRIRMQGSADAAAQTTGVWTARGLNLISTLNLAMTNVLALIVILESMEGMYDAAKIGQSIQKATGQALQSNPYTAAIGVVLTTLANMVGEAAVQVLKEVKELAPDIVDALWEVMNGVSIAEQAIARATPIAAYANAFGIARIDGADFAVGIPPIPSPTLADEVEDGIKNGLMFSLPVEKGTLQDVCARSGIGDKAVGLGLTRLRDSKNTSPWGKPPCDADPEEGPPYTRSERRWSHCSGDMGTPTTPNADTFLTGYHNSLRLVFAAFSLGTMGATSIAWEVIPRYQFSDICGTAAPAAAEQTMQIGQCDVCRNQAAGDDGQFHPEAWELRWNVYVVENQIPNQSSFNTALTGGDTGAISTDYGGDITDFQGGGTPDSGGSPQPVDSNVRLLWSGEEGGPKSKACNNGANGDLYPPHRQEMSGPDGHSGSNHVHTYYRRIVRKFSTCKIKMQWQGSGTGTSDDDKDKAQPLMLKVEPKEKMKNIQGEEEDVDFWKKHMDVAVFAMAGHDKVKPILMGHQYTDPYTSDNRQVFKDPLENPVASMFTYGQVRVFNQRSEDLFTPDWKAALVKFDMHERYGEGILGGISGILDKLFLH